jgi:lipoate-protein ligase A
MTSPQTARLIIDPPARGSWNMAVDQSLLLSSSLPDNGLTLRFYRWSEPTLSLGYFQKQDDRNSHKPSLNCPIIRRASGGGAIVHDLELTYSLCLSATNRWSKKSTELYDVAHNSIRAALHEQGIEVSLFQAPDGQQVKASTTDPFLCFQRRALGDLICDGHKVGGSAQRRLKSSLIQHGSLLLSQSLCTPELPGLSELSKKNVDVEALISSIQLSIARELDCKFSAGALTQSEMEAAKKIERETFQSEHWIGRR